MRLKSCNPRGLLFFIIFVLNVFCLSAETKKVKYGYFALGNYYKVENNTLTSYDSSYLDLISKYTDYEFEYVDCKTWDNAIALLEEHKIDLIGTMQWNMERELDRKSVV